MPVFLAPRFRNDPEHQRSKLLLQMFNLIHQLKHLVDISVRLSLLKRRVLPSERMYFVNHVE
ncbi:MAG: hypothetical protein NVV73_07105 [Cellvibrionaceae bacterium]|nr:hypothetical protein [Cellvibrionaceae bacterium]